MFNLFSENITVLAAVRILLLVVLLASSLFRSHNLSHDDVTYWDELYHATVAKSLMKHPLRPTLIDTPYLPYDYQDWNSNHVWLNKPTVPLWIIAVSYELFGVNGLGLRFPSLILVAAATFLTYLIGKELLNERAGLIAASLQAFNPELTLLVQGRLFADHVDVCLLFFVEAGIYFLVRAFKTAKWTPVLLSGICTGIAFFCKYYFALLIVGVAFSLYVFNALKWFDIKSRFSARHFVAYIGAAIVTTLPWVLFCFFQYPSEFSFSLFSALAHLSSGLEGWGAPWDRLLFDYSIYLFSAFYTPVLIAFIVMFIQMIRAKSFSLSVLCLWTVIVMVPNIYATTKTPSSTLLCLPALLLLFGQFIYSALRQDRFSIAAWVGVSAMCVIVPPHIAQWHIFNAAGYGWKYTFGAIMLKNFWVLEHLLGALLCSLLLLRLIRSTLNSAQLRKYAIGFCLVVTFALGIQMIEASWESTDSPPSREFGEVSTFAAKKLPSNAVLFFDRIDQEDEGDWLNVMFRSGRTCYLMPGSAITHYAKIAIRNGGIPFVVSKRALAYPSLFKSATDQRRIYNWSEKFREKL